MTPEERGKRAEKLFLSGYNCPQSVALAFADLSGMDADELAKTVSGFGGGICRMREMCGAVSGMMFILGRLEGYSSPEDDAGKTALYTTGQQLIQKFAANNGHDSYICADILGKPRDPEPPVPEARTEGYYQNRPCAQIVRAAAEVLSAYLGK